MITTDVNRMNLKQLVPALEELGYPQTADYFKSFICDSTVTIENVWIEKSVVERHIGSVDIMRELECKCVTWMAL